jgi:hypothetical protein
LKKIRNPKTEIPNRRVEYHWGCGEDGGIPDARPQQSGLARESLGGVRNDRLFAANECHCELVKDLAYLSNSIFDVTESPPAFTFAKYTPEANADPSKTC